MSEQLPARTPSRPPWLPARTTRIRTGPPQPVPEPPPAGTPVTVTVQFTVYGEDAFHTAAAVADRLRPIVLAGTGTLDLPVLDALVMDTGAPLRILAAAHRAELDGVPVELTRREYELLLHLAEHAGQAFTREQLLRAVWHQVIVSGQRTVDVHIRRLRAKLGDRGPVITTVRGVGYRLDTPDRVAVLR